MGADLATIPESAELLERILAPWNNLGPGVIVWRSLSTMSESQAGELRLGELLAALSLATDLGNGMPLEKTMRTCLLAVSVGQRLGLAIEDLSNTFYATLLRSIGCTAFASEEAAAYGDDIAYRNTYFPVDFSREEEIVGATRTNLARDEPAEVRATAIQRFFADGPRLASEMAATACSVAVRLASRLGMGAGVAQTLTQIWERWDGRGFPHQLVGDEIGTAARLIHLATVAEIDHRVGGSGLAVANVRRRRGGWFDPQIADAFLDDAGALLAALEQGSVWDAVLEAEPTPVKRLPAERMEEVTAAFGDFVDLKSTFTLGHSSGVARLAGAAAERLGLPGGTLGQAGHLHDLGRVSVSNGIWDKPGPLTMPEWERVRLHAYYGERVLSQTALLAPLAPAVGMHHERLDGSGYHRNAPASVLDPSARILAAADVYQALTEPRPHRPAVTPDEAARHLHGQAVAGRLDREAVAAVLEVAGHRAERAAWPAGLTDREVDVLILLARGRTRKEIAAELFISPSTVHTHTLHVYEKTEVKTRAAVALFAMEHDLLRP
jgi:HD-GYP domain-containing protein (c-di-GMP phosphodiesterase class II)